MAINFCHFGLEWNEFKFSFRKYRCFNDLLALERVISKIQYGGWPNMAAILLFYVSGSNYLRMGQAQINFQDTPQFFRVT